MRQLFFVFAIVFFTSCEQGDNFYTVTKIIDIQDTIVVNEPFYFDLIIRNDSLNEMKFTIDDTVQKSVYFDHVFYCNGQYLSSDVENPKSKKHNYQKYFLQKGDSLTFNFQGIFRQVNTTLEMEISGYDRVYKIENVDCNHIIIDFGGMWLPGDFNPFDAMEGYNFRKRIFVKSKAL